MKRNKDYFRAKAGTVYKLKHISVAVDPASGPWATREFVGFGEHGKVRVDIATSGGTPEILDFKLWRFPVFYKSKAEAKKPACEWRNVDCGDGYFETSCGEAFSLNEGSPSENNMKFCPFCGLRIA